MAAEGAAPRTNLIQGPACGFMDATENRGAAAASRFAAAYAARMRELLSGAPGASRCRMAQILMGDPRPNQFPLLPSPKIFCRILRRSCEWSQGKVGAVPARKAASKLSGQVSSLSRLLTLSIFTISTPSGTENSLVSEYCGNSTAFFMNSAQMGAAACAPSRFKLV